MLAGGSSRRLQGLDKTAVTVNGRSFLDRVLSFWPADAPRIAVGLSRETEAPVTWCREDPPGGGPVSALAAALPLVTTDLVAVVGADLMTDSRIADSRAPREPPSNRRGMSQAIHAEPGL